MVEAELMPGAGQQLACHQINLSKTSRSIFKLLVKKVIYYFFHVLHPDPACRLNGRRLPLDDVTRVMP
jgi:hypothetical protein